MKSFVKNIKVNKFLGILLTNLLLLFILGLFFWAKENSYLFNRTTQSEQKVIAESKPIEPVSVNITTPEPKVVLPQKTIFGQSVEGKNIEGYIFGQGQEGVLFFAAIHGHEKGGVTTLENLTQEINSNLTLVGKNKKVVIIPITNPDGYLRSLHKVNANNVNVNINFDTSGWVPFGGEGNLSAGSEPFSEPESRVIRDVVKNYNIKKMIAVHSKGSLVNPEIHQPSIEFAKWYSRQTGYRYFIDSSWDYPGTATKWFTQTIGGPAITVELSCYTCADWIKNKKTMLDIIR